MPPEEIGRQVFVVDHDLPFIYASRLGGSKETSLVEQAFLHGAKEHRKLPKTILFKDDAVCDELQSLADALGIELKRVKHFQIIPLVVREMTEYFSKMVNFLAPDRLLYNSGDQLFDDCPVCQVQKKALKEGRTLSEEELQAAFRASEDVGGIIGGACAPEKE